jgi:hypothetical protein
MASSKMIEAIEAELERLDMNASDTNVSGFIVTTDPEMEGPLPPNFVILYDDHIKYVDDADKILDAIKAVSESDEYGTGLHGIQQASEYQAARRQELVQILGVITTKDQAGVHFTENYTRDVLDSLESLGWVEIHKPVHEATGLEYSEENWSLEVTPEGQKVVDEEYQEYEEEGERISLCIDNGPGGYVVSNPDSIPRQIIHVMSSDGPMITGSTDSYAVVNKCWEAINALTGWKNENDTIVDHDRQTIFVSGRKLS